MNCCYTDEDVEHCPNRRLEGSPMCAGHLRYTFRVALVDGLLPADVFKVICADAVRELGLGMKGREISDDQFIAAKRRQREEKAAGKAQAEGVVYYVRLTGDRVKIGWTRDLENRMAIFRARPEDVLATEPGGRSVEARRHRQFAADRIGRSEDFTHSEQLARHIASLTEQSA